MLLVGFLLVRAGLGFVGREQSSTHPQILSGTPEKKLTLGGELQRWRQGELTVTVDQNTLALEPQALAGVQSAFEAWMASDADVPSVTLEIAPAHPAPLAPDGVNAIVVAPIEIRGHEQDLAITTTFVDSQTGEIVEADIIINSKYAIEPLELGRKSEREGGASADERDCEERHGGDWSPREPNASGDNPRPQEDEDEDGDGEHQVAHGGSPSSALSVGDVDCHDRYDLASVLSHEVGHFYGLGEDRQDEDATMFYRTLPCDTRKRSLESTEVETMAEVYAGGHEDTGEVRCSVGGVGRHIAAIPLGLLLGLAAVGGRRARRAPRAERPSSARLERG